MKQMNDTIIEVENVTKTFMLGKQAVEVIRGVSFKISEGEFIILFGPSGCGKSTVLNMISGLEVPTSGEVIFLGKSLYEYDEDARAQIRKQRIGMIYQQSNWVKSLNVLENVYFPLTLRGFSLADRHRKAQEMLEIVGMEQSAYQVPTELSSGQQQRVSLARALISDPTIIIADEPTGNLDSKASMEIMQLFKDFNDKGKTVIMVTHDLEYLKFATKSINMSDGVIIGEYKAGSSKLKSLGRSKRGSSLF